MILLLGKAMKYTHEIAMDPLIVGIITSILVVAIAAIAILSPSGSWPLSLAAIGAIFGFTHGAFKPARCGQPPN